MYFRHEDCQLCRKMTGARNPSVLAWRAQTDTWPRHCDTLTGVVILVLHTIIPTRVRPQLPFQVSLTRTPQKPSRKLFIRLNPKKNKKEQWVNIEFAIFIVLFFKILFRLFCGFNGKLAGTGGVSQFNNRVTLLSTSFVSHQTL